MKIDFDALLNRTNFNSKKWDAIRLQYKDPEIIPMGIADMDFPIPQEIIPVLIERLSHPNLGYTYTSDRLKNLIVEFLQEKYHWSIKSEWIIFYPDTTTSLYFILKSISKEKKHVIVQPPVFSGFFTDIKRAELEPLNNPLLFKNNHYQMDFNHLQNLFNTHNDISCLLLCDPHNPIGRVWDSDQLKKLAELCEKNNCTLISDEVHSDLIHPNYNHIPIASLDPQIAQNTITLYSPGKGFNISGVKISIAIVPNDIIRKKIEFITNNIDPNIFGLIAYETILTESHKTYTPDVVNYLANNFQFMNHFLKTRIPQLKLIPAQATFLAWVDLRALNMEPKELQDFLLKKAKLYVSQGEHFGIGGEGFARFNIGMPLSILEKALIQLEKAVNLINL